MAIRDRLAKSEQKPTPEPVAKKSPPPEVLCVHRSWVSVGKIKCGCATSPNVFTCAEHWVASGYCITQDPTPGKFPPDGPILLANGTNVVPRDDRMKQFVAWPLRDGETPSAWQVPVCATCPKRVEPEPHIAKLWRLGIRGVDTAKCDVLHVAAAIDRHGLDYAACAPEGCVGLQAIISTKEADTAGLIEATGCRLLILHATLASPATVKATVKAFPQLSVWAVLDGSVPMFAQWQRELAALSKELPNVWTGTAEELRLGSEIRVRQSEDYRAAIAKILGV